MGYVMIRDAQLRFVIGGLAIELGPAGQAERADWDVEAREDYEQKIHDAIESLCAAVPISEKEAREILARAKVGR